MKRLLAYLFLSFLIFIPKSFSKSYGEGDLKLSDGMIRYFHQYLKGKGNERPLMFSIAVDGSYAIYWYCPAGQCSGTNPTEYNKICSREAGVQCKIFAKGKYIKWKNGINVGKGKASKINSKQSFSDLKARLTELGFVGNVISEKEQVAKVQKAEEEKKKKAEEEKKKKAEEEKKRLEKEKLEAKRKADEEKKKLLEEKIKQQKALDEKKLSLLPAKPAEEKAKKALIDIQKFENEIKTALSMFSSSLPPCQQLPWNYCQTTYTWPDGNKYVGEWKNNGTHGQGIYLWADGSYYVGEYKDGKKDGQGTITWVNDKNIKYVGEFKNDRPHGQGTIYYKRNGEILKYVGIFNNGAFKDDQNRTFSYFCKGIKCSKAEFDRTQKKENQKRKAYASVYSEFENCPKIYDYLVTKMYTYSPNTAQFNLLKNLALETKKMIKTSGGYDSNSVSFCQDWMIMAIEQTGGL